MRKYQQHNWPELIEQFEQSDLNQSQFCKTKNINPKYFSQKRIESIKKKSTPFTQVTIQAPVSEGITLEVGRCKIHCPDSLSVQSLATLVQSLA